MATPEFIEDIAAVVFDFDGTLAHTKVNFTLMRKQVVAVIMQAGAWDDSLEDLYILEMIDTAAASLSPAASDNMLEAAYMAIEEVEMLTCPTASLFPGVAECLAQLQNQEIHIGIITRNCRRAVMSVLERFELPYEVLITRDDIIKVKPDPAHLLAALESLAVAPENAMMVGDHPTDIQCGLAAGAWTCGVLTDRTTREQHLQAGAHWVAQSVAELADLILYRRD